MPRFPLVVLLVALSGVAAQAQRPPPVATPSVTMPPAPVEVLVPARDSLKALLTFRAMLRSGREVAFEPTSWGDEVVRLQTGETVVARTAAEKAAYGEQELGITVSVFAGRQIADRQIAARPIGPSAETPSARLPVGGFEGLLYTGAGGSSLVVEPAEGLMLVVSGADAQAAELASVAAAADPARFASFPAQRSLWIHPETGWGFKDLDEYWTASPAIGRALGASPARLAEALPAAPSGTARTLGPARLLDAAPRGPILGTAAPRPPLPVVEREACYEEAEGAGPGPLELAALRLRYAGGEQVGPEESAPEPIVCLWLRALPPGAQGSEPLREAIAAFYQDGYYDASEVSEDDAVQAILLGSREQSVEGRGLLGGQAALRLRAPHRAPDLVGWWVALDGLRGVGVWHREGREAEAAALLNLLDLAPLQSDAGQPALFALTPTNERFYGAPVDGERSPIDAVQYASAPLLGAGARTREAVEVAGEAIRYALPVPDGWAVWSRHGDECRAESVALSQGPPADPCAPFETRPERGAVLFGGITHGPVEVAEQLAAGKGAELFGITLPPDVLPGQGVEAVTVEGAEAAIAFSFTLGETAYRALVLQHETLGAYGLLVAAPPGERREAERLLLRTAAGLRALP